MSMTSEEEIAGFGAPRSLKEELASLRIDRKAPRSEPRPEPRAKPSLPQKKPTRRRWSFWGLLTLSLWIIPLSLLGGGGYVGYLQYQKIRPKTTVKTTKVEFLPLADADQIFTADGYVKSRNHAKIGANAPGRVVRMLVEEGTRVKKGDLMAVLEHNTLTALLESRQASIARVEAEYDEAKADGEEKARKARRYSNLLTQRQASSEQAEEAQTLNRMAQARIKALEAAHKLAIASAKEMEETIKNMYIYAPFDGTVVEKAAEVGETITLGGMGGNSGRGSVVTLDNLDLLDAETDVSERDIASVVVGQPASITLQAVPGKTYRGRVRQIIPTADRSTSKVKVKVEFLVPDAHLLPDLKARVLFLRDNALTDPNASKSFLFVAKQAVAKVNGQTCVWVVSNGVVRCCPVEIVVEADKRAGLKGSLQEGEVVILDPSPLLRDGESIKVDE